MIWLAVIVALIGAGCNALATVFQKLSSGDPAPRELFSRKFITTMLRHKLWLAGVGLDFLGYIFQAAALYIGSLVIVEPILTVDLAILFLIIRFRYGARAGSRGWLGVVLVCAGISTFLMVTDPSGGDKAASDWRFALAILFVVLVVLAAAAYMQRAKADKHRIIAGAIATGLNFSLTAIFTKLAMADLSRGVLAMLAGWPFWAMIVSAASALIVMQATYASGSLKLSQPIITIVGPVCSVIFGVYLFGTSVRTSWPFLLAASVSAIVIMAGIVLLTGTKSVTKFQGNELL